MTDKTEGQRSPDHPYNAPGLCPLQFLQAVYHDPTVDPPDPHIFARNFCRQIYNLHSITLSVKWLLWQIIYQLQDHGRKDNQVTRTADRSVRGTNTRQLLFNICKKIISKIL